MAANISIRRAKMRDIDALCGLLYQLFSIEKDFTFNRIKQERGLEMMLDPKGMGKDRVVLVADVAGVVVGMCSGQMTISTARGAASVLVEDVVVATEWQGKGIGKKLLGAVQKWAKDHGAARMQLLADKSNQNALEFYGHLGWQETNLVCRMLVLAEE